MARHEPRNPRYDALDEALIIEAGWWDRPLQHTCISPRQGWMQAAGSVILADITGPVG